MAEKDITVDGNLTNVTSPSANDRFLIVDNAATALKDITWSVIRSAIWDYLTSLTAKTTLTGADQFSIADSAASNVAKKITWTNVLAEIQADLVASTTASGVSELAIASEVDTGTDATRAVTPDALAGSVMGMKTVFCLIADSATTPSATGDGKVHFMIPPALNGMNLVDADGVVTTVSSSGTPTFAVRRERSGSAVDMLSTNITIDQSEKTSYTAATAPVINTSNDDVATGDIIYIDLDTIGTSAKGHGVILTFQLP